MDVDADVAMVAVAVLSPLLEGADMNMRVSGK